MKKKLVLTLGLLAVGIVLFILSFTNGISSVAKSESIQIIGERYNVWAEARLETSGICPFKEATLTFKVLDADDKLLAEKTLRTENTTQTFSTTYTINDFQGIPKKVVIEVDEAKFQNGFMIAISVIVIGCSLALLYFVVYKDKKQSASTEAKSDGEVE